ncbi:hypothetical protein VWV82_004560 [Cronobacter malonaticus]|uniref:hypothetical protein n=1 Tax=Cronobacter malonaticus TaxID=413503 RepID=UPI0009078B67|nr:hypothetical protein [Cronobacter malonaticus]EMD9271575.1 hypothetical protein [Cronobacter malonaticus]EMD9275884.1 hypothetical protein [Cronobacter malonaticus]
MHSENNELVKAGHELAKCLDNEPLLDIAKMIVRLADKLDVTNSALREKTKQCEQLVAENAALIESHKYAGLSPKYNEPAMIEMKRPFIDELIHRSEYYQVCGHISAAANRAIKAVHGDYSWLPETPATDAFLREVKAQGVEMFSKQQRSYIGNPSKNDAASSYCSREALQFAAQLRQGGAA